MAILSQAKGQTLEGAETRDTTVSPQRPTSPTKGDDDIVRHPGKPGVDLRFFPWINGR